MVRARSRRIFAISAVSIAFSVAPASGVLAALNEAVPAPASNQPLAREGDDQAREAQRLRDEGRYREAEPVALRALAIRERVFGQEDPDTLASRSLLGVIYRDLQRYTDSETIHRSVLAVRERVLGAEHVDTLDEIQRLGYVVRLQGRFSEAEPLYRRCLELSERILGSENIDTLIRTNNLATLYLHMGRTAEAERLYLRALGGLRHVVGPDHRESLKTLSNLAGTYRRQGRFAEAEAESKKAIAAQERTLGIDHADTISSVGNLAAIFRRQGRFAEAEPLYRRVLVAQEKDLGVTHRTTVTTMGVLAQVYYDMGRVDEAEPLLLRVIPVSERILGSENRQTIVVMGLLGSVYEELARYGEAETWSRRALEASERAVGPDHSRTAVYVDNLAGNLKGQGRFAEAETLFRRAIEIREKTSGPIGIDLSFSLNSLAGLYNRQNRFAEAEALYRRALEIRERAMGADHRQTIISTMNLGANLSAQRRYAEAEPLIRRALELGGRAFGPDHSFVASAALQLGHISADQGRFAESELLYRRALAIWERLAGTESPNTIYAVSSLGSIHERQGRYLEAEQFYRRALDGREHAFGASHPDTLQSATALIRTELAAAPSSGAAMKPARLLLAGLRLRRGGGIASQQARTEQERERTSAASKFALFADAAWSTGGSYPGQLALLRSEAFGALQDSIAGAADRSIAEQAARRYVGAKDVKLAATIEQRSQLEEQWTRENDALTRRLVDSSSALKETSTTIRSRLASIQAQIDEIDVRLRAEAPEYFNLVRPTPLGISAAQALLGPDEAILLTVPSRFGTHVMAVTHEGIEWARSDWNADRMAAAVRRLRWFAGAAIDGTPDQLAALRLEDDPDAFDRKTAYALYQQLIAPVSSLLSGKRSLYVAAGGALAGLPFSLLVTAPPSGADNDAAALRDTAWFVDSHALIHIPSVQSLALLRRSGPRKTPGGFIGVGDPVLSGAGNQRGRGGMANATPFRPGRTRDGGLVIDLASLRQMNRLPGTAVELEAVRKTLHAPASSLLLAERATEPNVRNADLSSAGIILFSTHGLVASEASGVGEPGLVLTPPLSAVDGDDGFLAASEVTTLSLNADWVILSACNTATGDGSDNAGLGGLARSFFYAGARNLLASHWPVSDDVAPVLITRTLVLERSGIQRAEAFQQAMREIRMNTAHDADGSWAHPFYWAPFVLIGDDGRGR
ncbi:tetratricopeptide repeat protein [Sphingomonadaceae bacterium G21617-S1]|nr:tetratricopeptide repeat protein [Sphingomonadaceae bacterium G21617-S1]